MRLPNADQVRPIRADDETIANALQEASIPALLNALVHLTGDVTLLDVQRDAPAESFGDGQEWFGDPNMGITAGEQTRIRALALQTLKRYRDDGCPALAAPSEATIQAMLNFIVGAELPSKYVQFATSELAMNGEDPYAQPALLNVPAAARTEFKVLVVGAGMSGLLAAIRLAEAGISYTIIEKNADVGGTWLENTYPGCRVDSPNHTYSYSFAPNDWPQHYSQQEVLRQYFDKISKEFGVRDRIRFNTEVQRATFDEQRKMWSVQVKGKGGQPETLRVNAIISAVGQLNRPKFPAFPGQDRFNGPSFHSARWEHQHDLSGKRVAVIGTGASAFQFVPVIAQTAKEVRIFQRTPPWVSPSPTYQDNIPDGKHWLLNHVPFYGKWFRFLMFWRTSEGLLGAVKRDSAWNEERSVSPQNDALRTMLTAYIASIIGDDKDLLAKMVPDYPPGGKRMLVDNGTWLNALRRDNVHVTTDPISEVTPNGIKCASGHEYEADVMVYATGFHSNRIMFPMQFIGRGGVALEQQWDTDNPRAYLGMTMPNFPNLFVMYGPNTNIVVNGSIVFFSECEMRYILGCIASVLSRGAKAIEPKAEVHDRFNQQIDAGNEEMAWGAPNVSSWYKNKRGRVTQNWPFTLIEYWERTQQVNEQDYAYL